MIDKESLFELFEHFNGRKPLKDDIKSINDNKKDDSRKYNVFHRSTLSSYYRNDNYQKVPIKVNIEYTQHAYERIAFRELKRRDLETAISRGISSLFRLGDRLESDFKIYSYKYFTVIPGVVYFDKNRSVMRVVIKTAFSSPKPNFHNNEKLIYV